MAKIVYYEDGEVRIVTPDASWSGTMEQLAEKAVPDGISYEIVDDENAPYPFRSAYVRNYRNEKMMVTVSYNGVEAVNNAATRAEIMNVINYMLIENDDQLTVNWKGPNGWHENVTLADLQGLVKAGGALTQKAFNAEKAILENHAATPYTSEQAWKDDFDTEMEG